MRTSVLRIGSFALAALALGACGNSKVLSNGGAGDADASDVAPSDTVADAGPEAGDVAGETGDVAGEAGAGAITSFTVTATLSLMFAPGQGGPWDSFPKTQTFTMFVDAQTLRLVAGAFGQGTSVALSRTGADSFVTKAAVAVPTKVLTPCGPSGVTYNELSFSIAGGRLTGTGRGMAGYFTGDVGWNAPTTVTLVGVPDTEAPTIFPPAATIDPMGDAFLGPPGTGLFAASEPLTESAASLIGADGDVFALGAQIDDGPPSFMTGFVRSSLMLNWGTTYEVTTEALTDFAGNIGARIGRPKVVTPPAPPVAAEDGFESVQSATFGGAAVVSAGPFASTKSLALVNGMPDEAFPNAGAALALRLPVHAGDTVVRFEGRIVTAYAVLLPLAFSGQVRVGVPGREVNVDEVPLARELVKTVLPNKRTYYLGPVTTIEVPLPLGTNAEVSVEIVSAPHFCAPLAPPVAFVIDDLRVE